MSVLHEHQVVSRVAVASFDHHALLRLKDLEPGLRTGALLVGRPVSMSAVAGPSKADAMAIEFSLVTKTEVDACRAAGLQLVVWVVNEPAQMRYFIDLGVNGIITDSPDLLRQVLSEQRESRRI